MSKIEPISGHNDRVELKKVLPLKTPFTLNVFPINSCNFKCNFCAQSLGVQGLKEEYGYDVAEKMSLATFENIVRQSMEFDEQYKLLSFMGHGEPLLNKDLPKMIKMASDAKIAQRIEIITNGSLLTPELSDALIESGITNVRLSLEGLSAKAYKEVSNVDIDFDNFLSNLEYFHTKGEKYGAKLFVKVIDCSLKQGEQEKFYKMFDKISSRMYVEKVKPVYSGVEATCGIKDLTTDRYGNTHEKRLVCPMAFFSLAVWPNGDVAPCDAIYKPCNLGNVNSGNLREMFCGERVNNFRISLLQNKKEQMFGCKKCCAPDDVSHELDELDSDRTNLLDKFGAILNA